ncbi:hypothetical protein E2C01_043282 [Portunus trituberculatus]|uniref:Uncharacterized protein n=1 Tax=Portunus trituberculatus TaxID=210409 RepID=A0A5B7FPW1_PORTR|nr:hypothetical protein [Portunus trituberculatus]
MMAAIKVGSISHSRFAQLAEMAEEDQRKKITVDRSAWVSTINITNFSVNALRNMCNRYQDCNFLSTGRMSQVAAYSTCRVT